MTTTSDEPVLPLSVTQEQYDRIRQAEAVVVSQFTGPQGRYATLGFIGSVEECECFASTLRLMVVPTGVECDGYGVVPVSELLPPEEKPCEA